MAKDENKPLDIKIGTPEEVMWSEVKVETETMIKQLERSVEINRGILSHANMRIKEEKAYMKGKK